MLLAIYTISYRHQVDHQTIKNLLNQSNLFQKTYLYFVPLKPEAMCTLYTKLPIKLENIVYDIIIYNLDPTPQTQIS